MTEIKRIKKRGKVAPGKRQVQWRVRVDLLEHLQAEADSLGLKEKPKMIEKILSDRYYPDDK